MSKFFKNIIMIFLGMLLISTIGMYITDKNIELTNDNLQSNLDLINDECNKVFSDIDGSEIKYLELLKTEKDPFKIGLYSSALVQIYTYKQDYDKIVTYGENAIKNYKQVEGGAYYAIAEQKYLAWSMYNMGEYLDSFISASNLLDLLNSDGKEILTPDMFEETESLIYSIFLRIYTKFDIIAPAEIYYNKLCEISSSDNSKLHNNYIAEYSKLEYSIKINNPDLRKEYASNYYDIILELDKKTGNNVSDSALLTLGTANIYIGEYTQALDQIQRAEKIYIDMDSQDSLGSVYYSYAQYYRAVGSLDLALDYYNKSIDLYNNLENYLELKPVIKDTINFIELNNIDVDMYKYLNLDYIISNKLDADKTLNQLLSHIITINSKLGDSEIYFLEKEISRNTLIITLATIVIILLIILVNKNSKTKKTLENLANKDFLTGLNNRTYGERLIQEKINKNKDESKEILDKLRIKVSENIFDKDVKITFSAGISQWNYSTLNAVIKDADELLYQAKNEGKNKIM